LNFFSKKSKETGVCAFRKGRGLKAPPGRVATQYDYSYRQAAPLGTGMQRSIFKMLVLNSGFLSPSTSNCNAPGVLNRFIIFLSILDNASCIDSKFALFTPILSTR